MFHRKFISAIVGTAIAVSSISATSAQAGDRYVYQQPRQMNGGDALAATIAGMTALFIIGKAIENNNQPRAKAAPAPKPKAHVQKGHKQPKAQHGHKRPKHEPRAHHMPRKQAQHGGHGNHAHWHRHGNMKHIHRHGPRHHRGGH